MKRSRRSSVPGSECGGRRRCRHASFPLRRSRGGSRSIPGARGSGVKHFGISHARVGHVGLHGRPVEAGSCTGAAANGFIVLAVGVAEQGSCSWLPVSTPSPPERRAARCRRPGRLLYCRRPPRRRQRRQEGSVGNDQFDRLQAAVVQRDVVADQAAENVQPAARVTAGGALKLLWSRCGAVPVKSTALRAAWSTRTETRSGAPSSMM